jgi:hypothetical protein
MNWGESERRGRIHGAGSNWLRLDPAALRHASSDASWDARRACIRLVLEANRCRGTFWPVVEPDMQISIAIKLAGAACAGIGTGICTGI